MSSEVNNAQIARRLMLLAEQSELRRQDKFAKTKSLKEIIEEDEAQISQAGAAAKSQKGQSTQEDNMRIRLSDLIRRIGEFQKDPEAAQKVASQNSVAIAYTRRETEITIQLKTWQPVQGLVARNRNLAETDRYAFEFQDGSTLKITDKWSGKSTTIWGDPHVDVSDVEGDNNGDFQDMKGSKTHTTFQLEDGTRLTFTARDEGIIEEVDIFKGSQHLKGIGGASSKWSEDNGLFELQVKEDADTARSLVPLGDVVYAGGDGNDWFSASGQLLWGKTTGPRPLARPYASVEINIRQTEEQFFMASTLERNA